MAQQTAVEWLVDYIKNLEKYPYKTIQELEEQAKQMEKEQIVEAWNDGNFLGRNGNILADYSNGNGYYKKEFDNK